jgi:hypothetical protein
MSSFSPYGTSIDVALTATTILPLLKHCPARWNVDGKFAGRLDASLLMMAAILPRSLITYS